MVSKSLHSKSGNTPAHRPGDAAPPEEGLSVGFVSLGCAKNRVDSQIMANALLSRNLRLSPTPEEADVVLVNTCSFIREARDESLEAIRSVCLLKKQGRCKAVVVTGCLPQRYREDVQRQLPEVDAFLGLDDLESVADVVLRVGQGERGILAVSPDAVRLYEPGNPGVVFSTGPYAYLKIAEGCNHRCAFCAIPLIRGAHRSRPIDSIVREAERLLEQGFRELNLISQDTTSYGKDRDDGADLPALLQALAGLGGRYWIRLLYGYPTGVTERMLETMAALPAVVPYLDIPIQHSHPDILRAMKRAHTAEPVRTLCDRIRKILPDVALRTTCLVGFPGETKEQFEHLLRHVRENRYDHLGVFVYSPEEGTAAVTLPDRPTAEEAEERRAALLEAQQEAVQAAAQCRLNTRDEVLLERRSPNEDTLWQARSRREAPEVDGIVWVDKVTPRARPGEFVKVRYTQALDYDMMAEAERPPRA